ncbi:MAG: hypothetical protein M0002_05465 [Rhodospirillales bacterium]|nr:hypothetical protein [Rhodospirillales bacterium]
MARPSAVPRTSAAAKAARPERSRENSPGRSYTWLQGLLCGVAATLVPGPALLIGMLLAPGLVALLLDQAPGKPMPRAVLLCGLAAAIAPLASLWNSGGGIGAAFSMLGNPAVLGEAWLAGAGGWLLNELAPLLLRVAMDAAAAARAARLNAERARLVEAWDLAADGDQAAAGANRS